MTGLLLTLGCVLSPGFIPIIPREPSKDLRKVLARPSDWLSSKTCSSFINMREKLVFGIRSLLPHLFWGRV